MSQPSRVLQSEAEARSVECPYCSRGTIAEVPGNYAPIYAHCELCGKKFIVERLAVGLQTLTLEEAPCSSDPDCREIEMGGGDEE